MRIKVPCASCIYLEDKSYQLRLFDGELDDNGLVFVHCDKNHESCIVYDSRRYEVLLQSATSALIDGYTNEAISSYSTALERMYEFYIRVYLRAKGIDRSVVDTAWKTVSSQSERQFGAFHFLFLVDTGNVLSLEPRIPEIRNSVIHKGRIAREENAYTFGRLVFERICMVQNAMNKHAVYVAEEQSHEIEQQKTFVPTNMEYVMLKAFSVKVNENNTAEGHPETFDEYAAGIYQSKIKNWTA